MMVIGLTGGIACGKNTVATMLRNASIPVIDADIVARFVTQKGSDTLKKIVAVFGDEVLASDQTLDRKKLAQIIFNDYRLRKMLEAIVHKEIEEERKKELKILEEKGHKIAVYMAPLIFETGLHHQLDKTLLVVARRDLILDRVLKRDGWSLDDIQKRMDAQMDEETKKTLADEIIENNGSLDELYKNLVHAWKKLTGMELIESPS